MLFFWCSSLFLLTAFDRAMRQGRVDLLVLKTRRKLFHLRNTLRWEAINGRADINSWLFDYLDTSLTRSASSLPNFTVYTHLGNVLASRKNRFDRHQTYTVLCEALRLPANEVYRCVYEDYQHCLATFLAGRHKVAFPLLSRAGFFNNVGADEPNDDASLTPTLPTNPNISTLGEYCHK